MQIESTGSLNPRTTTTKGKDYTRYYIYLPSDLVNDSAFPFELEKLDVKISIKDRKLIIENIE